MRPPALWRHEARRAGWTALLAPPSVLVLGTIAATIQFGAAENDISIARTLLGTLEMLLPLAAGVGAASLIGHDPVAELAASCRTGYPATLLRRLTVSLAWITVLAVLASAALAATGWWERWPAAHAPLPGQLTWLSPVLFLAALGFLAGALLRNPGAAAGIVAVVWLTQQVLNSLMLSSPATRMLNLFATTRGGAPEDWTANRLVLLGAAVGLFLLAWVVLTTSEAIFSGEGS
ncbi:hypothetical protein [Actinophytocola sp.]|uniref:hypothetical protein n=1 Tax=Actinophytocola sp. TaxID=1872138 RepID=UPI002ED427A6